MNLILASASPRRKELLANLRIPFTIQTSSVQEKSDSPYVSLALDNALLKSEDIAKKFPQDLVIGADTVIEFENRILGKPRDRKEAFHMLSTLSGKTHLVTTGCAICCASRNIRIRFAEISKVTFRPLTPERINEYLDAVPVLDKAGAYAIQDHGEWIVEKLEGSLNNVIGFPAERFVLPLKFLLR